MSFNTLRAGLVAFAMASGLGMMAGCGDTNPYPDGTIPPLDTPGGGDTTLPDTPLNRFNRCFPPNQSLEILLDGRGAAWGSPQQTKDGGSVLEIDRASLSLIGGGSGGDAGTGSSNRFRATAKWGSAPLEFYTMNPGDSGYGLMAGRTTARANGEPLTSLRRSGMNGSWAQQFPGFTQGAQVGFLWSVEGDLLDPTTCRTRVTIRGAVRTANGGQTPSPHVAVPLYSPRPDGFTDIASLTFANEGLAVVNGALEATFQFPDAGGDGATGRTSNPAAVSGWTPVTGSGLQNLEATMIVLPRTDDAGPGDGGTGGGDADADAGSGGAGGADGGIPPLPGDGGAGGGG